MTRGRHPSDDPGAHTQDPRSHPSSGANAPSPPRRSGTGERQAPRRHCPGDIDAGAPLTPGEILCGAEPVVINAGKQVTVLRVANTADRPIQVGSHYHFAEVNPALEFDRGGAWGKRLNVASGGSMRFEPGAVEEVELVPIGGQRIVAGLRGECGGALDG